MLPFINSEVVRISFPSTFSNRLGSFLKTSCSHTPFPQSGLPGSVVSWWRFFVVVAAAFLLIQQACILWCSRVKIRIGGKARNPKAVLALALSEIAMSLGKAFNLVLYAKIMASWTLFYLTSHSNTNQLVVFWVCNITQTIVFLAQWYGGWNEIRCAELSGLLKSVS